MSTIIRFLCINAYIYRRHSDSAREWMCVSSLWLIELLVFLPTVHQNYVGTDAEKNPFFLSVVLSDQNNQRIPQYHSILWRSKKVRNNKKQICNCCSDLFVYFCYVYHMLFPLSPEFKYLLRIFILYNKNI